MERTMLTKEGILELLSAYGIHTCGEFQFVDSSQGEDDIRRNYIIDKKYVLRLNSAHVMNDKRIADLNRLIQRYRDFGIKAPCFIPNSKGSYTIQKDGYICYLSEYLDCTIADDILDTCRKEMISQRVIMVAKFAQRYKGVDLIDTMSMYSIFDLSPYDALLGGIDDKQDNCNTLIQDLKDLGEIQLAEYVFHVNEAIRRELLSFYKELPRCVFQGDENFSNVCVDDKNTIIGLFDFNMAGTEVNANYLANIAFQGNYYYTDGIFDSHTGSEIFEMVLNSYQANTALLRQHYHFTEQEFYAYKLYSKLVILFGYWNQYAYSEYAKNEKYKKKSLELLHLVLKTNFYFNNLCRLAGYLSGGRRHARKFCVSEFRQTQEYHVYNVHNWGLFPLSTVFPGGWDGMRECRPSLPGALMQGDPPTFRSVNRIRS